VNNKEVKAKSANLGAKVWGQVLNISLFAEYVLRLGHNLIFQDLTPPSVTWNSCRKISPVGSEQAGLTLLHLFISRVIL